MHSHIYIYTPISSFNSKNYFNVKKVYIDEKKVIELSTSEPHAFFEIFSANICGEYQPTGQYYKAGVLMRHIAIAPKITGNRS